MRSWVVVCVALFVAACATHPQTKGQSMRIGHIELPITNPDKSITFYRDALGFKVDSIQGGRYVWLSCGETTVLLNPDLACAAPNGKFSQNLVLYTNDLKQRVDELRGRGVTLTQCGACFHFRDPDGNLFQLVNPGDDHSGSQLQ